MSQNNGTSAPPGKAFGFISFQLWWVPVLLCLLMAAAGWREWTEPIVDFGREVHVASRVANGETLYEDIFYFNGPISPWVNSTAFRIFGQSIQTLNVLNLLILLGLIRLMWGTLQKLSSGKTATFACVFFVLTFPLSHIIPLNIFNYLAPYSHEATHGLLMLWALLALQLKKSPSSSPWTDLSSGIVMTCLFLCKTEFAVAGAACLASASLISLRLSGLKATFTRAGYILCGLFGSLIIYLMTASMIFSGDFALRSLIDPWIHIGNNNVTGLLFYQIHSGFNNWLAGIKRILWVCFIYGLGIGSAWIAVRYIARPIRYMVLVFIPAVLAFFCFRNHLNIIIYGARPLPAVLLLSSGVFFFRFWKTADLKTGQWFIALITALALLLKIFLNVRLFNYGFTLAVPATMLTILLVLSYLPRQLDALGFAGKEFAVCMAATLLISSIPYLWVTHSNMEKKTTTLGTGANQIFTDNRGKHLKFAAAWIEANTPPDSTLLSLPEVTLINFLTQRQNPTPLTNLMPPEYLMQGGDAVLEILINHPPDYILLCHKDTSEYGFRYFGRDYATEVGQWISQNYRPVFLSGAEPFTSNHFGMMIMQNKNLDQSGSF